MPNHKASSSHYISAKPVQSFAGLYRTLWRWHFYAGLFCIPFVLTLAASGSIFLFKPQIDNWIDRPYHNLEMTQQRSSANQQISAALGAIPNATFLNYQLPEEESHAVIISIQNTNAERILVYVNPYTLQVLKTVEYNSQFTRLVRSFHGELLAGNFGSVIIELAGCWAIVLILSGLYLWWPRNAQGAAGILYPRLKQKGRFFWKDLHAVIGFWCSILTLFLLISGLPWALVWGSAFKQVREWQSPNIEQSWTISRSQETMSHNPITADNVNLNPALLINAQNLNFAHPVELSISKDQAQTWTLKSQHQNRTLRANANLNQVTGEVVQIMPFDKKSTLDKVIGIGISAHEGQLFGWFNQLLGLLICLSLFIVSISGFILWRQRKPDNTLGAPTKLANIKVGKIITSVILLLAIFLPLLAISLIFLTLIEYFVFMRIAVLRTWLGLDTRTTSN